MSASPSIAPEASEVIGLLPEPLAQRASGLVGSLADPNAQSVAARAAVDAFHQVSDKGQGDIGWQASAWDRAMGPVIASARQGLSLETMAQDAGFGGNVGGFLAQRMLDHREPALQIPAQPAPWHPQLAPHDFEMGQAVSQALGSSVITAGAAARVYHEIRAPEGEGWSAGVQFIQTIQNALSGKTSNPVADIQAQLEQMKLQGRITAAALTMWHANVRSPKGGKP